MAISKLRLTEKEYQKILNNKPKISLQTDKTSNQKISLKKEESLIKEKAKTLNVYEIAQLNKKSIPQFTFSESHFSLVLEGARLLSINQIFALLQSEKKKHQLFNYKKTWHDIVKKILEEQYWELKSQKKELPYFEDTVEITLFRQAPRLVDEDALTTMFKYIIDAFKRSNENPYGILAEDNPKIVSKIETYSEKGDYCVGIRIRQVDNSNKENYTASKILLK